jgi:hypothetical protein
MQMKSTHILVWLLSAVLLIACQKGGPPPIVSIQQVTPSGDIPLIGGDTVEFDLKARADHIGTGINASAIVQSADGFAIGVLKPIPIFDGQIFSLKVKAQIPNTSTIHIFVAIYQDGAQESIAVDTRKYLVVGMRGNGS